MNKMKKYFRRQNFLMGLLVFTLLFIVACNNSTGNDGNGGNNGNDTGGMTSKNAIVLTISSFLPGPDPLNTQMFEPFIEEIEKVTEGRVTADLYPGSILGNPNQQYDLVVTGVADMSVGAHGYTPGEFPLTSVTELPFLGSSAEDATRIFLGLKEKFPKISEEHVGTKIGWLFMNDPGQLLTVDKPVRKIEDLKGMRVRAPNPAASALLEAVGAIPVSMPIGDVYDGLQRGVIDGTLTPASTISTFQLDQVANYVTKGDFYASSMFVVINPGKWSQISEKDQQAIEELMGERLSYVAAGIYDYDADKSWGVAESEGLEVYELSESDRAEWSEALKPVVENWIKKMEQSGVPGQEIYNAAIELRKQRQE